jgi:hypothetical protein
LTFSDLNPAIYEAMRATLAKVFAGEEPEVPGPGKLEVPVMDAIQGTRWLAHELVETIESSDLPPKHKAHLIGFTISKLVAREVELLKLL